MAYNSSENNKEVQSKVAELRVISSNEIFGIRRMVSIEHQGVIYRLQITRHGKLILTK